MLCGNFWAGGEASRDKTLFGKPVIFGWIPPEHKVLN